jgi:hypothetical protein
MDAVYHPVGEKAKPGGPWLFTAPGKYDIITGEVAVNMA